MHDESASSRHPLAAGASLGDYSADGLLGEDCVSFRYVVKSERLGNRCMARVFTARWCERAEVRAALRAGAQQQSRVVHAHVMTVRDVFETEHGEVVVVTDYVDGPSAAAYLAQHGRMGEAQALEIVAQVLAALTAAHRRGLLHLALSPSCLWLQLDGERAELRAKGGSPLRVPVSVPTGPTDAAGPLWAPKSTASERIRVVVDAFGLGRVLPADESEWAPEQIAGEAGSATTDVWAAARLLLCCLTGEVDLRSAEGLRERLPTLSLRVERALRRALDEQPGARPESAEAFAALLRDDGLVTPALRRDSSPTVRARSATPALAAALVLLVPAAYVLWLWVEPVPQRPGADAHATGAHTAKVPPALPPRDEPLPVASDRDPLPLGAVPSVGSAQALVDLVFVVSFAQGLDLALALAAVEPLQQRYGDNLCMFFLVRADSDPAARARALAALAAGLQGRFVALGGAMLRQRWPGRATDYAELVRTAGLDAERFRSDLESRRAVERLEHHQTLLAQWQPSLAAGTVLLNGRVVSLSVASTDALIRAIDVELDQVQSLLNQGVPADAVAQQRTREALADARAERGKRAITLAHAAVEPRFVVDLEGLPLLGAPNAPVSAVLFFDPLHSPDLALLAKVREACEQHPERLRLSLKLTPDERSDESFARALELLAEQSRGRFWEALDSGAAAPSPEPAARDLHRLRLLSHLAEQRALLTALAPIDGPAARAPAALMLVNGRFVEAADWEQALVDEEALWSALLALGLSPDEARAQLARAAVPLSSATLAESTWLLANWAGLPRLGQGEDVALLWSGGALDAGTARMVRHLLRLVDERLELSVLLLPGGDSGWNALWVQWQRAPERMRTDLERFVALDLHVPSVARAQAPAVLAKLLGASFDPADADATRQSLPVELRDGAVWVGRRRGSEFSVTALPDDLAYEPYWDAVVRAGGARAPGDR